MMKPLLKIPILTLTLASIYSQHIYAATETVKSTPSTPSGVEWTDGACIDINPCLISNLAELRWLSETPAAWDEYYVQTADIDASETASWNESKGWDPIGDKSTYFTGSYDGKLHKVDGLTINDTDLYVGGFFSTIGTEAEIKNLMISNADITSGQVAGILAGKSFGRIERVATTGSVAGYYYIGGLLGLIESGSIENSYSSASISGTSQYSQYAGGAIGEARAPSIINNIYSTGAVDTALYKAGGLIGVSKGVINNSLFDSDTSGYNSAVGDELPMSTANMQTQSTYTNIGWDFDSIWKIESNNYPTFIVLPNEAPVAIGPNNVTLSEDSSVEVSLIGGDVDGDTLTYAISTQPTSGSITLIENVVTYTPNQDFNGQDTFEFVVNDGTVDSEPALVTVDVSPVNDAPQLQTEEWLSESPSLTYPDSYQIDKNYSFTSKEGYPAVIAISQAGTINVQFLIENAWVTQGEFTTTTDDYKIGTFDFIVDDSGKYHYSLIGEDNRVEYGVSVEAGWDRMLTDFISSGNEHVVSIDSHDGSLYLAYFTTSDKMAIKKFNGTWSDAVAERYITDEHDNHKRPAYHLDLQISPTGDLHLAILQLDSRDLHTTFLYSFRDSSWSQRPIMYKETTVKMWVFSNDKILMLAESGSESSPSLDLKTITGNAIQGSTVNGAYSGHISTDTQGEVYLSYVLKSDQIGQVKKWDDRYNSFINFTQSYINLEPEQLVSEISLTSNSSSELYGIILDEASPTELMVSEFQTNRWLGDDLSILEDANASNVITNKLAVKDPDSLYEPGKATLIHSDISSGNLQVIESNFVDVKIRFLEENGERKKKIITITGDLDEVIEALKSVQYTPSLNFYGESTVEVDVEDDHAEKADLATMTLRVSPVDDAPIGNDGTLVVNEDASAALDLSTLVTELDGDNLEYIVEGASVGSLTLSGSVVTYTPNSNVNGSDSFTYTVLDASKSKSATDRILATNSIVVTIHSVDDAPVISGTPATTIDQGAIYYFKPTVVDADASDTHEFAIQYKPSWATFNEKTGELTGTPKNGDVTSLSGIVISVRDSTGLTDALPAFNITVRNVNDAPEISNSPTSTVLQDEAYHFIPTISDVDINDSHTFTINNKPEWLAFNDETGQLSGTPIYQDIGSYSSITLTVTDEGGLSDSLTFDIEVQVSELSGQDDSIELVSVDSERYVLDVMANDVYPKGSEPKIVSATTNHGRVEINGNQLELVLDSSVKEVVIEYFLEVVWPEELTVKQSTGHESLKDSATVELIIVRNDVLLPVIEVPADVEVNADALFTKVDLGTPSATDSSGNTLPVSLVDGVTLFAPGTNKVQWKAVDEEGRESIETQTVRVHPLVSLPKDAVIQQDQSSYVVEVLLNGEAPYYPVFVPYAINGEAQPDLIIFEGTTGSIELLSTELAYFTQEVSTIEVVLGDGVNKGDKATFALTLQEAAMAPEVSSVVMQNSIERQVVDVAGGDVTITASVDNKMDAATYGFEWKLEGSVAPPESSDTFVFTPSLSGEEAEVVKVTVDVNMEVEGTKFTTEHEVFIEVRKGLEALDPLKDSDGDSIPDSEEGYADSDKDGVPDFQDAIAECNVMQERAEIADGYLVEAEAGLCLRKGITVANNHHGGLELDIEHDELKSDSHNPNIGGVFDFVITGLKQPGDYASIVIPQVNPIPEDAKYAKYKRIADDWGWVDFEEQDKDGNTDPEGNVIVHGYLSSAPGEPGYCPPPGNPESANSGWTLGLNKGDWCVQLIIKDGGLNDADGIANGTVVDPGGVAIALSGNTLPVANEDSFVVYLNEEQELNVLVNDEDAEGQVIITSASANLGNVEVQPDGMSLLYTPATNQIGSVEITYSIEDTDGAPASARALVAVVEPRLVEPTPDNGGSKATSGGSIGTMVLVLLGGVGWSRRKHLKKLAA
ncbi:Ig-like domain-containing protein [Vibrio intestinalis]|uniref:Ig-like domain-containing protein n=1 Tax=Vibrio intestinalis TaxID=2933291 RepID=UPI0021A32FDF|nr:tandem-95 repeat protein [Vibrio intestinalis]